MAVRPTLQEELRQRRPFAHAEEEAWISIVRTADHLQRGIAELLKRHELTITQYNVLRILRGAGAAGHPCREVGERMITREPDVTRLLDRMQDRGWVRRERSEADRRVVIATITPDGLEIVRRLDEPIAELTRQQLTHLGDEQLHRLLDTLTAIRFPNGDGKA
ncbi:MAG: MarR family transcriptional regulator [Gemmatimonadales bacterium]|nr:MarR family transcriptional regulator [Gemmatimonadales bacterium]